MRRTVGREERVMRVSADIGVIPIGVGVILSEYVAVAVRTLSAHGLVPRSHAHGSSVEGELPTVLEAIGAAIEAVHAAGAPRVSTSLKLSTRVDRPQSDVEKVSSLERRLGSAPGDSAAP